MWTVPPSAAPIERFSETERDAAAWLAVALVVLATWMLRGLGPGQTWWTAPAAALAAASSLNWVSARLKEILNQVWLVSGYVTIFLLMIITFVAHVSFDGREWYSQLQSYFVEATKYLLGPDATGGGVIAPVLLAVIPTILIWMAKARYRDQNKITIGGVIYTTTVTLTGAVFVIVICAISDQVFSRILFVKASG